MTNEIAFMTNAIAAIILLAALLFADYATHSALSIMRSVIRQGSLCAKDLLNFYQKLL
jgi:hypothetical protein